MNNREIAVGVEYFAFVETLKNRVLFARNVASHAINRELITLYWDIGCEIVKQQHKFGWGESVIDKLSYDLKNQFTGLKGFSSRNLRDMRRFYLAYSNEINWRQAVANFKQEDIIPLIKTVPWGHHLAILNKTTDPQAQLYYLYSVAKLGWSRQILLNQIKAQAYERTKTEKKSHNFDLSLPNHLAELAEESLKSRYNLEFLGLNKAIKERDLETHLINELQKFILELGYGFCFIGRQYSLKLGEKEYFIDLLFYHRFLKALVAVELKIGHFEPEFAGKMDFYLNLLNENERGPGDNPSIGIILCAEKDTLEVEFSLKSKVNPIGVAEYHLQPQLPSEFKGKLPTKKQFTEVLQTILPSGRKKSDK